MRKGSNGGGGDGEKMKRMMKIVATTSLPAVDHPNANHWNTEHSCHKEMLVVKLNSYG